MENVYLIVGLGNPGADYAKTRHNAGFLVTDRLAGQWGVRWQAADRFEARLGRVDREGRRILLCQPQTYMNASGDAVVRVADYFKAPIERLLVIVDDADLPFGQVRMRPGGSSGGHHGLESIESQLGTREYARQRIGIGRQAGAREITNYVLGRFRTDEFELLDKVLDRAARQVESWLAEGTLKAMNRFNGTVDVPTKENDQTQ